MMYEELVTALRKRAIELPKKFSKNAENIDLFLKAADAIEELSRDLDSMNDANIALYGALPKWIPVTERLPEIGEKVLVFAYSKATLTARMCEQTENGYPVFECNGIFLEMAKPGRITHWMQTPEPPKEDE